MHVLSRVCVCACTCSISLRNSTTSRMKEASIILNFWQKKRVTRTWWTYCAFLLCRIYLLVGLIILRCTNLPASSSIYILSNITYPLLVFWVPKF